MISPYFKKSFWMIGAVYLVGIISYYFQSRYANFSVFAEIWYLVLPLIAVVGGILAIRSYSYRTIHGKSFLLLTIGLASWLFAEIIWLVMDLIYSLSPFPSIADIFFVVGYPCIAAAIIHELKKRNITLGLGRMLLLVFTVVFLGVLLFAGLLGSLDMSAGGWALVMSLSYGIGDFLLLFVFLFVLFLAQEYEGGRLLLPWSGIFLGLTFFFIADLMFAYYGNIYHEKGLVFEVIDSIWMLAYACFALGLWNFYLISREMSEKIRLKLAQKIKNQL